jgi:hypothetical protein
MMPTSLAPGATVSAQDRSDVIDLVNRLNMAFDVWDLDTMLGLHTDDFTVHHPKGWPPGTTSSWRSMRPIIRLQSACVASI